eukprot:7390729-Prymnesium_polylepis.1
MAAGLLAGCGCSCPHIRLEVAAPRRYPRGQLVRVTLLQPRGHFPPFSGTTPTYQRAFLNEPRTMSVILFSQTCCEDLLDPRTLTSRHFER